MLRVARAQTWPSLLGVTSRADLEAAKSVKEERFHRILARDADRTFIPKDDPAVASRTKKRQQVHITNLLTVISEVQDYHQGMGYIGAFLALFLDQVTVASILLQLHRSDRHSKGYFLSEPQAFVRDARVLNELVKKHIPPVGDNLTKWGAVPEMYTSKWMVGLGVHFLPFEFLFDYMELYFRFGSEFLFRFGLSYYRYFKEEIATAPGTSQLMLYLRAEDSHSEWNLPAEIPVAIFGNVLANALKTTLDGDDWQQMRVTMGKKVAEDCEIARKRLEELKAAESEEEFNFTDDED